MHVIRDIFGASISAFVTGLLFLGPAFFGIIYAMAPRDMVEELVIEARPPVRFDGAFELAEVEIDGDLDGTTDAASEEDDASEPDEGEGGDPDGSARKDAKDVSKSEGADVVADPALAVSKAGAKVGARAGGRAVKGRRGSGRRRKRSRQLCPRDYDGIKRRSDGVFVIDRSLVRYHTSSMAHFNELGWSRSNKEGKGWIISGFDCQGPLWHGGMRRGDVVLSVNGKRTNNMLQILRLYPKLKRHRKFEVDVIRKGRSIRLRYEIVG